MSNDYSLGHIPLAVILALMIIATYGCTPFYEIEVAHEGPDHAVQAFGESHPHEVPEAARYYSMVIDLRRARPFAITFPDGFKAMSMGIDRSMVLQHLEGTTVPQDEQHPAKSWMAFDFGNDGHAYSMSLYACRHVFRGLFATSDDGETYDFPLRRADIERLFGGPVKVYKSSAMSWYHCI